MCLKLPRKNGKKLKLHKVWQELLLLEQIPSQLQQLHLTVYPLASEPVTSQLRNPSITPPTNSSPKHPHKSSHSTQQAGHINKGTPRVNQLHPSFLKIQESNQPA